VSSLTVIGLGGRSPDDDWDDFSNAYVVARSDALAATCLPAGVTIDLSFSALFDGSDVTTVADEVVQQLLSYAEMRDVVYLTPGVALLADLTVERLIDAADNVMLVPGEHVLMAGGDARLQFVDALALADAEQREPFGAGLCAVDPAQALVVSNWHGATVTELAARRLRRLGFRGTFEADEDGNLYLAEQGILTANQSFAALQQIYARLRRPDGCPWDREQTELTTVPHIIEETDELREALELGDWAHAAEELGDVLGNVLMIAQIAHEHGHFGFEDVVASVSAKLIRRHPHVFGDARADNPADVLAIWNQVKQQERADSTGQPARAGVLANEQEQGQA
jgi:tetrapyrrole methylase family protein / MazG family protein